MVTIYIGRTMEGRFLCVKVLLLGNAVGSFRLITCLPLYVEAVQRNAFRENIRPPWDASRYFLRNRKDVVRASRGTEESTPH